MAVVGRRGVQVLQKVFGEITSNGHHARTLASQSLPDLPYDYGALEPAISGQIMELHHKKHHATYVAGLNAANEKLEQASSKNDVAGMIALEPALRFNGGGHVNHSIFWTNLTPPKDFEPPSGELESAISAEFGSLDDLIAKFNAAAVGVQGSGWGWLAYHPAAKRLLITTTANQDPAATQGVVPLLGVDVWEHAYYLQYKNVRPDYMKAIWSVINWKNVAERYKAAKAG